MKNCFANEIKFLFIFLIITRKMKILIFLPLLIQLSLANSNSTQWLPYLTEAEFEKIRGILIPTLDETFSFSDLNTSRIGTRAGFGNNPWTNAQVPYILDSSLTEEHRRQVAIAIGHYHEHTCIRFIPKESSHRSWLRIEYKSDVCGLAQMCMPSSGQHFAQFGGSCVNPGVMIHELGHSLCMGHEQTRQDRDEWIQWDTSKCQPHSKDSLTRGLHKLYDYVGVEHYEGECYSGCIIPKQPGVTKCGSGGTLSVLDIELLNEMYNCKSGCQGLRFVNHNSPLAAPVVTGTDIDGSNLYTCRAYHDGDIIPGKYHPGRKECYVPYGGGEHKKTGQYIEVLTDPNGAGLVWIKSSSPTGNSVKGGRSNERQTLYVVRCDLNIDGRVLNIPGKFHNAARASFNGKEYACGDNFYFLGCRA